MGTGFVIMPFGEGFDDIYKEIYVPVVKSVGLEPLRADEIYDNQPIIRDIKHSIYSAKVILADVTGRNPNVNYELGVAHALGKEVIIITADSKDVPSDYRHIRYIEYNRGDIDWNRKLAEKIENTLHTVLSRIECEEEEGECTWQISAAEYVPNKNIIEDDCVSKAIEAGYKNSFFDSARDMLVCKDARIELSVREEPCDEWTAAAAYLLNENVKKLSAWLPDGHYLKMRRLFIDNHASHGFDVDYIYNAGSLPIFTRRELDDMLRDEFEGQIFEPTVRFLEENTNQKEFQLNGSHYYQSEMLPEERKPVVWRNGYYIANISKVYVHEKMGHSFYCIEGLLPLAGIGADAYVDGESHWLADWGHSRPRCRVGDTVSFKIHKVYPITDRGHALNARNINFGQLKKLSD